MFDYRLRHKRRAQGMQPLPAKPFEMILDPGQPGCMHDLSGDFIPGGDSQGGTVALRGSARDRGTGSLCAWASGAVGQLVGSWNGRPIAR
jgi:hypothetical protein